MKTYGLEMILPEEIQENFEIIQVKEKEQEIKLVLVEKEEKLPEKARREKSNGEKIVRNGYCNLLELVDFPLKGKICYLELKRRRWKISGTNITYENHYKFHEKGVKCTLRFGNFLKSLGFIRRRKFFRAFPNIRHIREEDFSMVSRIKRFFKRR